MNKKLAVPELQAKLHDYKTLYDELWEANDRAFAILHGAYLEAQLELVLKSFLIGGKPTDALFDVKQPLGDFDGKTRVAHALGLLLDSERHNLDVVKWVRNKFAHDLQGRSFKDSDIADKCQTLLYDLDSPGQAPLRGRSRFNLVCLALSIALADRAQDIRRKRLRCQPWPQNETASEWARLTTEAMFREIRDERVRE